MDGLGITADEEPHFIAKPPPEAAPELSDADEEAMAEIEDAVDDGSPVTDIAKAISENAGAVKKVVDKMKNSGKKDDPDCPPVVPPEDRAHYFTNEMPTCADWAPISEEWGIA